MRSDRFIEAKRLVAVQVAEGGIVLHRQPVFEQGDRAEAIHRNAAPARYRSASPPEASTRKPGTDFSDSVTLVGPCKRSRVSSMVVTE